MAGRTTAGEMTAAIAGERGTAEGMGRMAQHRQQQQGTGHQGVPVR